MLQQISKWVRKWFSTLHYILSSYKYNIFWEEDKRDFKKKIKASGKKEMDWSYLVPERKYQQKGSCASHAVLSLVEIEIVKKNPNIFNDTTFRKGFSEMYHYYLARKMRKSLPKDTGMTVRDAFKCIDKYGICPEKVWPDRWTRFNTEPTNMAKSFAYILAKEFVQLKEYFFLNNVEQVKNYLLQYGPVLVGVKLFKDCYDKKSGKLLLPIKGERFVGGHAVLLTAYKKDEGFKFKFLNSWGSWWGKGGFGFMDEIYLEKYNLGMASAKFSIKL